MMYDVYSSEVGRRIYDLRIYTNTVVTVCVSRSSKVDRVVERW